MPSSICPGFYSLHAHCYMLSCITAMQTTAVKAATGPRKDQESATVLLPNNGGVTKGPCRNILGFVKFPIYLS